FLSGILKTLRPRFFYFHVSMKPFLVFFIAVLLVSCKKSDSIDRSAKTLTNVSYGTNAAETMDVYLPAGRSMDSTKTIVMIHGGAWVSGDKSDFASFIPVIQQRFPGYAIANINYKLATTTDNHFPTQENDMKAALDYLVQKASDYQLSHNFILLGASAGAHMALVQAYKYPSPRVLAVVDFFGPTNMVDLYNFYSSNSNDQALFQLLMSGTPQSNPALYQQSSPINFVTSQSCPTIIFHGTADVIVPLSESVDLKNKLSSLGVPNQMTTYPNVGHEIWPPNIMTDVYNQMEQFIKTNVH
ncbi:MAG: prolyl oligopeptidase family serine peptidase, partial [Flavisolibacter sp.]